MPIKSLLVAFAFTAITASSAPAAILTVLDDTTLLINGSNGQRDANFGGRTEVIIGATGATTPRYGILRFDISTISSQITAGTEILSATLTLTERSTRDGIQNGAGTGTRQFSVHGITAANAGWVEGTADGALEAGTASLSYRNTGATNAASTDWASGGGNGPTATDLFTFGTDTGAAIGTGSVTFATGSQQTLVFDLDTAALATLLGEWQAQGANNAGLAIRGADGINTQTFWDSNETGVGSFPATLNITFVPEPGSLALLGLGSLGLIGFVRRCRL